MKEKTKKKNRKKLNFFQKEHGKEKTSPGELNFVSKRKQPTIQNIRN